MGLQLETLVDGFQDEIDHRGSTRKVSICGRNIDSDPTTETDIEFLPLPKRCETRVWDFLKNGAQNLIKSHTFSHTVTPIISATYR